MSDFRFVQVTEFQPAVDGWRLIGPITKVEQSGNVLLLSNAEGYAVQLSFLSETAFRVRFRPVPNPDYSNGNSYAVVERDLGPVRIQVRRTDEDGGTLMIDTGTLVVKIGLTPYGLAVYKQGQLIHEDEYGSNLMFSNEATACMKKAPEGENYYGFGEKAGAHLNKKNFTLNFFNYDNFTYNDQGGGGFKMVPENNDGGPLNPSGPLYNSMPYLLAVGSSDRPGFGTALYSYGIFLDNVSQTFFNLGSNDYSNNMTGRYYFGALYGEMDYYVMVGNDGDGSPNAIADVIRQYSVLTGASAMPPKYAFGYQQGCYGYYDRKILLRTAKQFREARIPIDGLHIDVDFQNNYRTFTVSPEKFPDPKDMFDELHDLGYKCSTNITGIISANPLDETGQPADYPTRDELLNLDPDDAMKSTYKSDAPVHPFLNNTRNYGAPDPDFFFASESYGQNNGFNPYPSPSPGFPHGNNDLSTYGYYCDMGNPNVQAWWGRQYKDLLTFGLDMIWQDMTCPAVVPNKDNATHYKTLPLDLMMYDKRTGDYEANAKIHNCFAINLVEATYHGITALKESDEFKDLYNYKKRNFIIARGGFAGIHRYAGIWTGDSASSWDFLRINIPEVLNIGLSGLPISGCDIGGFANGTGSVGYGITEYELYTRWMTLGAFLPWYRNHYDGYTKKFQEPYRYGEPVPSICRKYINIRYQLMQLFYDAMYENTQTGMPIARALFLNDPYDSEVYGHLEDQFFVGKDLLVAPVVTQGAEHRDVYLPAGSEWYVFSNNTEPVGPSTRGGATQHWYAPLDIVPMYVREGAIVPLLNVEQYVGELKSNPITFQIYPGKDSVYTLYQDDEVSTNAETQGEYRVTEISHQGIEQGQVIEVKRTYDRYTPPEEYYYIALLGTTAPATVRTLINGQTVELSNLGADPEALSGSGQNAFYHNASLQTTFIKIFDRQADVEVRVSWSGVVD